MITTAILLFRLSARILGILVRFGRRLKSACRRGTSLAIRKWWFGGGGRGEGGSEAKIRRKAICNPPPSPLLIERGKVVRSAGSCGSILLSSLIFRLEMKRFNRVQWDGPTSPATGCKGSHSFRGFRSVDRNTQMKFPRFIGTRREGVSQFLREGGRKNLEKCLRIARGQGSRFGNGNRFVRS